MESHLTIKLKKQIKDMRLTITDKDTEITRLKKNIKITQLTEVEIELRTYVDECTRLRHLLEEVLKSRDPLSDPAELANIESHFQ